MRSGWRKWRPILKRVASSFSQNILPLIKTRRVAGQSLISVELPLITSLASDILPLIKTRRVAGQSLISVELPLITSLASDPRAQKTLLEIFQMRLDEVLGLPSLCS